MRSIGSHSFGRWFGVLALGTALTVASANVAPQRASAQCTGAFCTDVRPDGKGIIGLGLLGAELGLFIPAIVQNATRSNEWWPYLVFPLVGAAAGIVGGYFMEQETRSSPEVDVAFMVAGMVLIVPTIVGTLALAAYQPPSETVPADDDMVVDDQREDSVEAVQDESSTDAAPAPAPSDAPTSDPAPDTSATQSRRETHTTGPLAGGAGLLRFDGDSGSVLLGVPVVGALPRYTPEEVAHVHVQQTYDVHVPVVSATF